MLRREKEVVFMTRKRSCRGLIGRRLDEQGAHEPASSVEKLASPVSVGRRPLPPSLKISTYGTARAFVAAALLFGCCAGCATAPSALSPTEDPVVSSAQLVSGPPITVHDEHGTPSISYASDLHRDDESSGVVWMWQSTKERESGKRLHGVFWTHTYVAREPRVYQSVTLADGSSAALIPDEVYDGRHITSKCDGSTCRISESWVVFFDDDDVRAASSNGLTFTMHAKDGSATNTSIPAAVIDAVLRSMDQP